MDDARAEIEEPCHGPDGHIFRGQFQRAPISTGLSSYSTAHATNRSAGSARGPLLRFSLCVVLG